MQNVPARKKVGRPRKPKALKPIRITVDIAPALLKRVDEMAGVYLISRNAMVKILLETALGDAQ